MPDDNKETNEVENANKRKKMKNKKNGKTVPIGVFSPLFFICVKLLHT